MNRILVIDPAGVFIQYVALVVNRHGYRTTGVMAATQALDLLTREPFDLVMAQETLPDMSWPDFCQKMPSTKGHPDVPVVVLSADPHSCPALACSEISVAKVRTKPVSMRDLITVVQEHLPFRNKRRRFRAPLPVKSFLHNGDDFIPCQALNLSEGGVFIMRKDPLPVGTSTRLLLDFPGAEEPMEVRGKVVYTVETARGRHPRGVGIEFDELDAGTREKLRHYLESHVSALLGR